MLAEREGVTRNIAVRRKRKRCRLVLKPRRHQLELVQRLSDLVQQQVRQRACFFFFFELVCSVGGAFRQAGERVARHHYGELVLVRIDRSECAC